MVSNGTTSGGDGGATRRDVLKGATAAVGAFIAFEAIGGVSLAAGASPKTTQLANGVIFPDPRLCIGCLTCEVICYCCYRRHRARLSQKGVMLQAPPVLGGIALAILALPLLWNCLRLATAKTPKY